MLSLRPLRVGEGDQLPHCTFSIAGALQEEKELHEQTGGQHGDQQQEELR